MINIKSKEAHTTPESVYFFSFFFFAGLMS